MSRQQRFAELTKQFACHRVDPLIAVHKIRADLYDQLRVAAALYLSRSLPQREMVIDESALLNRILSERSRIKNFTPNGLVVPKRHSILEYNALVKAFAAIMDSLHIESFISSWHVPLNLRYKDAGVLEDNMRRNHPTEDIHSDSWAGESSESVTTIIPLFGDAERNRVDYFSPPEDFEEQWLGPRPSYRDGAAIAERYRKLDVPFEKGNLYVADFAMLHASARYPGSHARVSIDTTFALRRAGDSREVIHPWREGERASHDTLMNVGITQLFVFPDSEDQQVDSQGGFKHPTNLHILPLMRETAVRPVAAEALRSNR